MSKRSEVIEALIRALKDAEVVVQDRAVVPLAILVGLSARIELAESTRTLVAPSPPLATPLNATQARALGSLVGLFQQFGDRCTRPDAEWLFAPWAILSWRLASREQNVRSRWRRRI